MNYGFLDSEKLFSYEELKDRNILMLYDEEFQSNLKVRYNGLYFSYSRKSSTNTKFCNKNYYNCSSKGCTSRLIVVYDKTYLLTLFQFKVFNHSKDCESFSKELDRNYVSLLSKRSQPKLNSSLYPYYGQCFGFTHKDLVEDMKEIQDMIESKSSFPFKIITNSITEEKSIQEKQIMEDNHMLDLCEKDDEIEEFEDEIDFLLQENSSLKDNVSILEEKIEGLEKRNISLRNSRNYYKKRGRELKIKLKESVDRVISNLRDEIGRYTVKTSFCNVFSKVSLQIGIRKIPEVFGNAQSMYVEDISFFQKTMKKSCLFQHIKIWDYIARELEKKGIKSVDSALYLQFDLSTKKNIKYLNGAHYYSRKLRSDEKLKIEKDLVKLKEKFEKIEKKIGDEKNSEREKNRLKQVLSNLKSKRYFKKICSILNSTPGRLVFMKEVLEESVTGEVVRKVVEEISGEYENKIFSLVLDKGPKVTNAAKNLFLHKNKKENFYPRFGCISHTFFNYICDCFVVCLGGSVDSLHTVGFIRTLDRISCKIRKNWKIIKNLILSKGMKIDEFLEVFKDQELRFNEKKIQIMSQIKTTRFHSVSEAIIFLVDYRDELLQIFSNQIHMESKDKTILYKEVKDFLENEFVFFRMLVLKELYQDLIEPCFFDIHRHYGYGFPQIGNYVKTWKESFSDINNEKYFRETRKFLSKKEKYKNLFQQYLGEFKKIFLEKTMNHLSPFISFPASLFGVFNWCNQFDSAKKAKEFLDGVDSFDFNFPFGEEFKKIILCDSFRKLSESGGYKSFLQFEDLKSFFIRFILCGNLMTEELEGAFTYINFESKRSSPDRICSNICSKLNYSELGLNPISVSKNSVISEMFKTFRKKVIDDTKSKKHNTDTKNRIIKLMIIEKKKLQKSEESFEKTVEEKKLLYIYQFSKKNEYLDESEIVKRLGSFKISYLKKICENCLPSNVYPIKDEDGNRKKVKKKEMKKFLVKNFEEYVLKRKIEEKDWRELSWSGEVKISSEQKEASFITSTVQTTIPEIRELGMNVSEDIDPGVTKKIENSNFDPDPDPNTQNVNTEGIMKKKEKDKKCFYEKNQEVLSVCKKFLKNRKIYKNIKIINEKGNEISVKYMREIKEKKCILQNPSKQEFTNWLNKIKSKHKKLLLDFDMEYFSTGGSGSTTHIVEVGIWSSQEKEGVIFYGRPPHGVIIPKYHCLHLFLMDKYNDLSEKLKIKSKRAFYGSQKYNEEDLINFLFEAAKCTENCSVLLKGHNSNSADLLVIKKVSRRYGLWYTGKAVSLRLIDNVIIHKLISPTGHWGIQNLLRLFSQKIREIHSSVFDAILAHIIDLCIFGKVSIIVEVYFSIWESFQEKRVKEIEKVVEQLQVDETTVEFYLPRGIIVEDNSNYLKFLEDAEKFCIKNKIYEFHRLKKVLKEKEKPKQKRKYKRRKVLFSVDELMNKNVNDEKFIELLENHTYAYTLSNWLKINGREKKGGKKKDLIKRIVEIKKERKRLSELVI